MNIIVCFCLVVHEKEKRFGSLDVFLAWRKLKVLGKSIKGGGSLAQSASK